MMVGVRRRWGGKEERRGEKRRDVMLAMLVEQLVSRLLVLEFGVLGMRVWGVVFYFVVWSDRVRESIVPL